MARTRGYQPDEMARHMMSLPVELQDEVLLRLPKLIKYHLSLNSSIRERFGANNLPFPDPSINPTTYYIYPESDNDIKKIRYLHIDGSKPIQHDSATLAEHFNNLDYFSVDQLVLTYSEHIDTIIRLLESNKQLCGFIFVLKNHIKKNQMGELVKTREEVFLDENIAKYYNFKKMSTNYYTFYSSTQLNVSKLIYSYFMNTENYAKKNIWFSEQFFQQSIPVDDFDRNNDDGDDDEVAIVSNEKTPNIMEPSECVYCLE